MSGLDLVPGPVAAPKPPRLLDQLRELALARFGRAEPGHRYADWALRYILFCGKRHPRELGASDVGRFLKHVAHSEKEPLRSLEQAHEALTFLYQHVLGLNLGELPLPQPPRLLDRVRFAIRVRHYSARTEDCYAGWVERYIRFHGLRHPCSMGGPEIEMFLTDLAVNGHVSASTQNQAFSALLFLYQEVLGLELPRLDALRARRPKRLPAVLSAAEVRQLLAAVRGGEGVFRLMAGLCYGAGLRREECCKLRVHDLDLSRQQIIRVHDAVCIDRSRIRQNAGRAAANSPRVLANAATNLGRFHPTFANRVVRPDHRAAWQGREGSDRDAAEVHSAGAGTATGLAAGIARA